MELKSIGIIHSPYKESAPFQGKHTQEVAKVGVFKEFEKGLKDLERASHLIILYLCDRANRDKLEARPPHDTEMHGVFATRSPNRPNPIALCVVELIERDGNTLKVKGLDALDGSPLIDIKPYVSQIDSVKDANT
jgi:tRNA-Thr(GGU) m(6)t(6)A37 methyltransferase TsaA